MATQWSPKSVLKQRGETAELGTTSKAGAIGRLGRTGHLADTWGPAATAADPIRRPTSSYARQVGLVSEVSRDPSHR